MNTNGIRNGERSLSQRSIYDYPEHLNPFYEDENHKRLRFWKIGAGKSNRSNSFSLDGLKGLWSFKTFKLKKKSSSLAINKTSESPPVLRRNDERFGSQPTIDNRMRHTVDIGLGSRFQRGGPVRSSLQELNSVPRKSEESFFIRNNRYRSTIQAIKPGYSQSNQYQSNPNIEPSRYNQIPLGKGSSQFSVNSNPFEDEYDTISEIGSPQRTSARYSARKKRRAPQPPISLNKPVCNVQESCGVVDKPQEAVNIISLTAEIESFVRTADTDKEILESKPTEFENVNPIENFKIQRQSPENNDYYPQEESSDIITIEKIENLGEPDINGDEQRKKSRVKILIRAPTDEEPISTVQNGETHEVFEHENKAEDRIMECTLALEYKVEEKIDKEKTEDLECDSKKLHIEESAWVNIEKPIENNIKINHNTTKCNSDENEYAESENIKTADDISTPISPDVDFMMRNDVKDYERIDDTALKIIESSEDLTKIETEAQQASVNKHKTKELSKQESVDSKEINNTELYKFEVRTIPLKLDSPELRKKSIEIGSAKKLPPTPPQRRRSVKEIIESINKCQSLLKVNQDSVSKNIEKLQTNSFVRNCNTNSSIVKQEKVIEENNNENTDDFSNIPLFVEKFDEFNNNRTNVEVEKYDMRGDRYNEKVSNVEYNPVPKPRRHRYSTQGPI